MADDDGFLSRWSRRKALVRQGGPSAPPPEAQADRRSVPVQGGAAPLPTAATPLPTGAEDRPAAAPAAGPAAEPGPAPVPPPPPTLDDVSQLAADAPDYSRFVARDVTPNVRNAALKKLFADPHFNVMDGLDIYIDDYSRPDPLPASMLRQLAQGHFLGLLTDDEPAAAVPATERASTAAAHNAALASTPAPGADASPPPTAALTPLHEDPDLRLQPHDAAGRPGDPAGAVTRQPDGAG